MADRRGAIITFIILGFILFSPDPARSPAARQERQRTIDEAVQLEREALAVQQNASYRDFDSRNGRFLNLTGLEHDRGFAWDALAEVKRRAKGQLEYSLGNWGIDSLEQVETAVETPSLWHNITGYAFGSWVRTTQQAPFAIPDLNLSLYTPLGPWGPLTPRPFARNITGQTGKVGVRFRERDGVSSQEFGGYNVTGLNAEISMYDESTSISNDVQVHGVLFPDLGQAILTTTSLKFAGIFALPFFALSEPTFEASRAFVNQSVMRTIELQADGKVEARNPWASNADAQNEGPFTLPGCELIVYVQQHPPEELPADEAHQYLAFIEKELRLPTGAFLPKLPDLRFSMLAFSPDCGFVIESKGPPSYIAQEGDHLRGPKIEVLHRRSRRVLLLLSCIVALQLVLLVRQMREASTPSTRSRLSFYTIAMLALGDGFMTMALLLASLSITVLWVNLIGTAFLSCISVSFFGLRFVMEIWNVQAPERDRRAREEAEEERQRRLRLDAALDRLQAERLARASENEAGADSGADGAPITNPPVPSHDSLPLPVTAQRPSDTGASAVFMPSDQEGLQPVMEGPAGDQTAAAVTSPASFGAIYTRFYLLLLATLFVSVYATSWPPSIRRIYFTVMALCYLSFWIPQINRNIQRNCRHALNWEFVVGQSVFRILPFAYLYGFEGNVLFASVDYYSLALLVGWLWIQIVVLISQELIGPRWFVRTDWAPPAYDYHPILRDDEEDANMPIGLAESHGGAAGTDSTERRSSVTKETKQKGKRVYDCAICMQELEVPVVEADASNHTQPLAGGLLARRAYMVTPCRHIFHSTCLEGWMKYRLQCPNCRETLPPL